MRLSKLYRSQKPDISVELFPPKTKEGTDKIFEEVKILNQFHPTFFSMTYGAGGSTRDLTLELVDELKNKIGVETMCHLTVVSQSKADVRNVLNFLKEKGVYNLIALRGDPPQGTEKFQPHPNGFRHAVDLVREAKRDNFFSVAVAGFPEKHPDAPTLESDIQHLKEKVDAGADAVITQLFFDNRFYYGYLDKVRRAGVQVPVIPGILPILSPQQVKRFTALCRSQIPPAVGRMLAKYENDSEAATQYGIELATQQCQDLIKQGVPGIHFYCLNRSRSVKTILSNLNQK